jgi:hypothetical protein
MTVQDPTKQEPRLGIDVIGFGVGEFAYLLNVFEGPARDRSVSVFRAEEMMTTSPCPPPAHRRCWHVTWLLLMTTATSL